MNLHCLHGFLGSGEDFNFLKKGISLFGKKPEIDWNCSLQDFGQRYNNYVRHISTKNNILIGYSLGGRLALHSLIHDESLYKGAVIISSHIGLSCPLEKQKRLHDDQVRSEKLKVCFKTFVKEWDELTIFKGSPEMQRNEDQLDIEALCHSLRVWSLGKQRCLLNAVENISIPLLFVAGEYDQTYKAIAEKLVLKHPQSRVWIAKECGHRVPWQSQKKFIENVHHFIQSL